MKFVIITLDGRYTGNSYFKYRLEFTSYMYGQDGRKFRAQQCQQMIEWLWENYGPGCERDHWKFITHTHKDNGPKWSWYIDPKNNIPYIYIVDDTVLSHVQLKWVT